jgi:hypothetical protein
MNQIITKKELEEMIFKNIDYDYEIFQKICDIAEPTKESLQKLPKIYQIIYSTTVIEGEIYNGGFYQYYGNSTAQEFNEIGIESFSMIGAQKTSALLEEVFNKIIEQSQTFKSEYQKNGIQDSFNKASDEMNEIRIEEYDNKFYEIFEKENVKELKLKYIKSNIDSFE